MSKPVWVYVYWSESGAFKDESHIPFTVFENICKRVARKQGSGQGYMKTKIKVLFDCGEEWNMRLDLCADECGESCFRDHCMSIVAFVKSERFQRLEKESQDSYLDQSKFIETINWE